MHEACELFHRARVGRVILLVVNLALVDLLAFTVCDRYDACVLWPRPRAVGDAVSARPSPPQRRRVWVAGYDMLFRVLRMGLTVALLGGLTIGCDGKAAAPPFARRQPGVISSAGRGEILDVPSQSGEGGDGAPVPEARAGHVGQGCGDFTNGRPYVVGRMSVGTMYGDRYFNGIVDTAHPDELCLGLPAGTFHHRIRPTDGRLLYIASDSLVYEFVPDELDPKSGGTAYKTDPLANDILAPTPNCLAIERFELDPRNGALYYTCTGLAGAMLDGKLVSIAGVMAINGGGYLLLGALTGDGLGYEAGGWVIAIHPNDGSRGLSYPMKGILCDKAVVDEYGFYSAIGTTDTFQLVWDTECNGPEVFKWSMADGVQKTRSLGKVFDAAHALFETRTNSRGVVGPDGSVYRYIVDDKGASVLMRYTPNGNAVRYFEYKPPVGSKPVLESIDDIFL